MPELPDVELFRRYFEKTAMSQEIKNISAEKSILKGVSETDLEKTFADKKFSSALRHGKHMFAGTGESGPWMVIHFGMTGFLVYLQANQQPPKHCRMLATFADGQKLAFDCRRKLGRIRLAADINNFIREMDLGPDALDEKLDLEEFKRRLAGTRGAVKSALMNQSVISGLGNIYTDEILFHAGIHPRRKLADISAGMMERLYQTMHFVLSSAIEAGAEPEQMPADFLIRRRQPGATCPRCGAQVEKIAVSGRNGYFCPGCQK
ncbi:MAG: Fpg/Nei family DNA glycosylase [Desulfobacterales bacterium]|nr:Fpg/Nei family DNA glycosylase [Desulfobacterales bacterium]